MARILVVEDDDHLLSLLCEYLRIIEHDPAGVNTAADAREAAALEPWDVIVADLTLPDGNGRDLGKVFPDIPLITISGKDEADLQKPFTLGALAALIRLKLGDV